MEHAGMHQEDSSKWTLNMNYRYFTSYKHFNGRDEQKFRVEEGSEVINYTSAMDFALTRNINEKWMVGISIPLVNYERTSKYEHLGNTSPYRFATAARGLGDIRLAAYRWLIAPDANKKGNLMAGIGIKLPTGNFKAQDAFQYTANARRIGYVDQSIQPGDGGFGVFESRLLDWRTPEPQTFPLILGCDLLYQQSSHQPLLTLLRQMLAPGGVCWLADAGRDITREFWLLAKQQGFPVQLIQADGSPREEPGSDFQIFVLQHPETRTS